jgi:hypothetical protein
MRQPSAAALDSGQTFSMYRALTRLINGMAADFYRFSVLGALKENDLTDAHIP